ncbi:(2Fe-2S)-binding protein [Yinghuangia seranimata]|uniref:(2Fe-2S)-binding protein n=1 Tax=Yinghuangia seranimata TaxID=408067 RepID=UPI00248BB0FB|nr:2Fe-2S iron-sulfur cluster-binding protein [Yinghuangia seranimata]MDI2131402.1 2Fe-2S iron-sulfur cluster-binding protein [Yinghuangia seranimata]
MSVEDGGSPPKGTWPPGFTRDEGHEEARPEGYPARPGAGGAPGTPGVPPDAGGVVSLGSAGLGEAAPLPDALPYGFGDASAYGNESGFIAAVRADALPPTSGGWPPQPPVVPPVIPPVVPPVVPQQQPGLPVDLEGLPVTGPGDVYAPVHSHGHGPADAPVLVPGGGYPQGPLNAPVVPHQAPPGGPEAWGYPAHEAAPAQAPEAFQSGFFSAVLPEAPHAPDPDPAPMPTPASGTPIGRLPIGLGQPVPGPPPVFDDVVPPVEAHPAFHAPFPADGGDAGGYVNFVPADVDPAPPAPAPDPLTDPIPAPPPFAEPARHPEAAPEPPPFASGFYAAVLPEQVAEPRPDAFAQRWAEPAAEPFAGPAVEPFAEPVPEPVPEQFPEYVREPYAEPVAQETYAEPVAPEASYAPPAPETYAEPVAAGEPAAPPAPRATASVSDTGMLSIAGATLGEFAVAASQAAEVQARVEETPSADGEFAPEPAVVDPRSAYRRAAEPFPQPADPYFDAPPARDPAADPGPPRPPVVSVEALPAPGPATDPAPFGIPGTPLGETAFGPPDVPAPAGPDVPVVTYPMRVNGVVQVVESAWIGESLLYVLRERLGLPGAKEGCGQGVCGACTVLVDGAPAAACLVPAATVGGRDVTTVEGLAEHGVPTAIQRALAEHGAVQCGFCIPGVVVSAQALLARIPHPDEATVRRALAGHPCRCAGPNRMVAAVCAVAAERPADVVDAAGSVFEPAPHAGAEGRP